MDTMFEFYLYLKASLLSCTFYGILVVFRNQFKSMPLRDRDEASTKREKRPILVLQLLNVQLRLQHLCCVPLVNIV